MYSDLFFHHYFIQNYIFMNIRVDGGQKLYLWYASKPNAKTKLGTLGCQGSSNRFGSCSRVTATTVGQGGLSSGLLYLSFSWSTVWVALTWWGCMLLITSLCLMVDK